MILGLALIGVVAFAQISKKMPRVKRGTATPSQCAPNSICFSGEVREGQEYRRSVGANLDFVLKLPGGIDVALTQPGSATCKLSAWVANPPLMAHHDTEIDAGYDWTAELEVQTSPRVFRFPTNCGDYERLFQLSQGDAEKYLDSLTSLAKGEGRLWITGSRVAHSHGVNGRESGAVEWMKFTVELKMPGVK